MAQPEGEPLPPGTAGLESLESGPAGLPLRLLSTELLRGAAEVLIEHPIANETQVYRLRRTSQGKLILTK